VPGADSLVERETVTLPMLLHWAEPRGSLNPCRD